MYVRSTHHPIHVHHGRSGSYRSNFYNNFDPDDDQFQQFLRGVIGLLDELAEGGVIAKR